MELLSVLAVALVVVLVSVVVAQSISQTSAHRLLLREQQAILESRETEIRRLIDRVHMLTVANRDPAIASMMAQMPPSVREVVAQGKARSPEGARPVKEEELKEKPSQRVVEEHRVV